MTIVAHPTAPRSIQGALPADELTVLLEGLRRGTAWRTALRNPALPTLSAKADWFTNEATAGFYLMLPVPSNGLAIDVGAGSGVIAGALTSRFRRVVALERDPRWCEFLRRRYAEDGVAVEVIQRNPLEIAETASGADLVVVNGVLECIQLPFLRGVRQALRRGGRIGIATENRYFYETFRGAVPRGVRGARGYRRLLAAAGFANIEIRAAIPSYHQPTHVMALTNVQAIRAEIGPRTGAKARTLDLLARAGLLGYAVHSFYISAERP